MTKKELMIRRRGLSKFAIASAFAVVVIIAVGFLAYVYLTPGGVASTTSVLSYPLISYSADAYAVEATSLLTSFSRSTGILVAPVKSGGSFADASEIAAGAPDDVFISASLSATGQEHLNNMSSNWAVGFASDQMVLAYSNATSSSPSASSVIEQGKAAAESNATSDWNTFFTSLTSGSVKVGISDPAADPAGLRGWLVLEAAGFLYANDNQSAYVATLLKTSANVTGTNAAALVSPLQSGQIQFLFTYKSAAISDHLGYLTLDRYVNLGDPTLAAFYSKFSYEDSAGVTAGAPIILCVTVPLGSINTAEALRFVQYVVENAGTLSSYGLQPFTPARLYNDVTPPPLIAQLVSQGLIVEAGRLP